jgi:hypothetical protein
LGLSWAVHRCLWWEERPEEIQKNTSSILLKLERTTTFVSKTLGMRAMERPVIDHQKVPSNVKETLHVGKYLRRTPGTSSPKELQHGLSSPAILRKSSSQRAVEMSKLQIYLPKQQKVSG